LAALFAQELQVRHVVVPYTASVNGAFGLATADVVHEYAVTTTLELPAPAGAINALFAPMATAAEQALAGEGFGAERIAIEWSVGMRYGRQVHEVITPVRARPPLDEAGAAALVDDFEQLYERRYGKGSAYRAAGVELTQCRVTARGRMDRPALNPAPLSTTSADHARIGRRPIFVEARNGFAAAVIYDFLRLVPGNVVRGPAVIHTPVTTIAIQERQVGRMDPFRNVIIEFE
jgi:N-methylhydantoinase A